VAVVEGGQDHTTGYVYSTDDEMSIDSLSPSNRERRRFGPDAEGDASPASSIGCPVQHDPAILPQAPVSPAQSDEEDDDHPLGCPFRKPKRARKSLEQVLKVSRTPISSSTVSPKARGKTLRFVVKDYGNGINPLEFEKVFKPFLQADAETERVFGGTGLGLAITAKLVKGMGGSVSVDSEVGRWTKFTVDFPLEDKPADISSVSKKLEDVTIVLVNSNDDAFKPVTEFLPTTLSAYYIRYVILSSTQGMNVVLSSMGLLSTGNKYVCLVHEDAFDKESYSLFSGVTKSALVTFGSKFTVPEEASNHFRCPLQVLPSVFMESLAQTAASLNSSGSASTLGNSKMSSSSLVTRRISSSQSLKDLCPSPSYQEMRVLVAEDNKVNQKVISRMLTRIGVVDFDIAENGLEAIEKEAEKDYDIILMDVLMPRMDGIEACKAIVSRAAARNRPAAPIIFASAHASEPSATECAEAGGSGFMPKPFNIDEVKEQLNKVRESNRSSFDSSALEL